MSISVTSEIIAGVLILIGTLFSFLSAIGLIRLPDVYTRSHAASKSSTIGVLFTLIGTLIFFLIHEGVFSIRLLLVIFFVFLTAPVSAHLICRSAYRSNVPLSDTSVKDELKEVLEVDK
ncbi:monovalent cation/H(+) antiporter subunit G [Cytobacillus purgationiresistens]|uniref:Multicomponent Na+:H+ antiporter subunit G n=1 Tax=Cytobacillus purgationiresistens TaxID=863449 RepID=A0ABU0AF49_9BACI|nr:monovalent cation/H(+) antiporter subunit G [Cytobacillus purgationiresistens]MDQ0269875.1 multicomponent Na+:H+ antiporter subunit G [Cytobacillus purgationiresistens]